MPSMTASCQGPPDAASANGTALSGKKCTCYGEVTIRGPLNSPGCGRILLSSVSRGFLLQSLTF